LLVSARSDFRRVRSSIIDVVSYDLLLDLTVGAETFWSRTELSFCCRREGARAFADLRPVEVRRVVLNGADVTGHHLDREGRLELTNLARENMLVVEAEFAYAETATGLYRFGSGENASGCVYSNANLGGAARIFCCFDQPDLRAPITVAVRAPAGWRCRANYPMVARPSDGGEGVWRFTPTPPLAPYQFAFCASPEPVAVLGSVVDRDPPVTLTIWPLAASGDPFDADMLTELVRRPLRYYADTLRVPYPYPKCDLVLVPRFPGLAFSPPGLATLQDQLLKPTENRPALYLSCVLAHELAHAWFGGLLDLRHEDDMWLQEALATYASRTALEETQPGSTPWASDTSASLPDHAYAKNAELLRQLEELIGRPALMNGLAALMRRYSHATISRDDLVRSWSQSSGEDLRSWAETLIPSPQPEESQAAAD
jgi:aminopeptidase N